MVAESEAVAAAGTDGGGDRGDDADEDGVDASPGMARPART